MAPISDLRPFQGHTLWSLSVLNEASFVLFAEYHDAVCKEVKGEPQLGTFWVYVEISRKKTDCIDSQE